MKTWLNRCHFGDCLKTMRRIPAGSVQTCVTSPPYFSLRDYGHPDQIGMEESPAAYVAKMVKVFRAVRRLLRDDGTLWLNLGDSYSTRPNGQTSANATALHGDRAHKWKEQHGRRSTALHKGLKHKDLIGIPWRVAFALQADGWYLRQEIIWNKPNPMPESVTDRCTKAHEHIFLLAKSESYYCDMEAIAEPAIWTGLTGQDKSGFKRAANYNGKHAANPDIRGEKRVELADDEGEQSSMKNKRSVWTVPTRGYKGAHFATFPEELIEPCILAGSPPGNVVLDPFFGSGTTGAVAQRLGRPFIGCELNLEYEALQTERLRLPANQPGIVFA